MNFQEWNWLWKGSFQRLYEKEINIMAKEVAIFIKKPFGSSWVGDNPQEDLAKFGYTYNRR